MAVLQAAAAVLQALCRAPGCRVANVWPCRETLPSWPGSPCHDTINCIVAFTPCLASFLLQYNSLPNGSLVTIHHSILRYKKKNQQPAYLSITIQPLLSRYNFSLPQAKLALVSQYNDCIVTQCLSSNGQ